MIVRQELADDAAAISDLNRLAFAADAEALLIEQLRNASALTLSMVAVENDAVVGHIAYSPVTIHNGEKTKPGLGLGPMAVLPSRQRKGIGAQLIETSLAVAQTLGHEIVVVVGHPAYYPRFGFVPGADFGLRWEHDVPAEAFMVKELRAGALLAVSGLVKYRPEFDAF